MPNDVSNSESVTKSVAKSFTFKKSTASYNSAVAVIGKDGCPFWIKAEMASHKKLLVEWKKIINRACYQKAFFSFLGEDRLSLAMLQHVVYAPVD